jgi:hypothetical protein
MALFNDDMCLLSGPSPRGESTGAAAGPKSAEPVALSHSLPGRCVFPLTRSQEGIWVEYQSEPTSTKYNLTLEWNLERRPEEEHVTILNIIKGEEFPTFFLLDPFFLRISIRRLPRGAQHVMI